MLGWVVLWVLFLCAAAAAAGVCLTIEHLRARRLLRLWEETRAERN